MGNLPSSFLKMLANGWSEESSICPSASARGRRRRASSKPPGSWTTPTARATATSGKKLKLDEETRWQIAGEAVEELRRYGSWKELNEESVLANTMIAVGIAD
jgi:hypothetical protein